MNPEKRNINQENCLFLLGGHDLEMLEIRKMLDEQQIKYSGKDLPWHNAKLSVYWEHFEDRHSFVNVELKEFIPPSVRYISMYHNIERAREPSIQFDHNLTVNL